MWFFYYDTSKFCLLSFLYTTALKLDIPVIVDILLGNFFYIRCEKHIHLLLSYQDILHVVGWGEFEKYIFASLIEDIVIFHVMLLSFLLRISCFNPVPHCTVLLEMCYYDMTSMCDEIDAVQRRCCTFELLMLNLYAEAACADVEQGRKMS